MSARPGSEKPSDIEDFREKTRDQVAASVYEALACRVQYSYIHLHRMVETYDAAGPAGLPKPPAFKELSEHYDDLVGGFLGDPAETAAAAHALVLFATTILIDRRIGELLAVGTIGGDRDSERAILALLSTRKWLSAREFGELRQKYKDHNRS